MSKAQLDNIFINKKRINSALICGAYSSFERLYSDCNNSSVKIRQSLRRNKKNTDIYSQYDSLSLTSDSRNR